VARALDQPGDPGRGVVPSAKRAGVKIIGALPLSLPPFTPLPLLNLSYISALAPSALAVAALGLIQTMAIARTLAAQTGERLDNNQEFVGQGLANIAAGFFSGYPGGGSISCSAINAESGAQTPLAAILSGVFTLIGMLALAPFGAYMPRAALSGVLIVVGIAMIDLRQMRYVWRGSRSDTVIMLVTLLGTLLFRIDFAVLIGILASLTAYILKTSMPQVQPVVPDDSTGIWRINRRNPCACARHLRHSRRSVLRRGQSYRQRAASASPASSRTALPAPEDAQRRTLRHQRHSHAGERRAHLSRARRRCVFDACAGAGAAPHAAQRLLCLFGCRSLPG
jgi:MFS superfamily sulfate permease-like transporter